MKYFRYISLTIILLLLYSCGQNPSMDVTIQPIEFAPAVSVETKDISPAVSIGSPVNLFGIRVVTSTPNEVLFENDQLLTRGQDNVWRYQPIKNWETTGHYYFAAVWPSASYPDVRLDASSVSINYQAGDSHNVDLMLAREDRDRSNGGGTEAVNLLFKHACSAVRFLFGKTSDATNYVLTSFKLIDLETNGTLTVPLASTSPSAIADGWHLSGSRNELFTWTAFDPSDYIAIPLPDYSKENTDKDAFINSFGDSKKGWFYMLPQTMSASSAVEFKIRAIINNGGNIEYGNEILTRLSIEDRDDVVGADRWIPNDVYNYYVTITQKGMSINVVTTSWDEVQATTEIVTFETM